MKKPTMTTPVQITEAPRKPTHRYVCDACTGVAFVMNFHDAVAHTVTCKACGKMQTFKEENLIKL